MARGERLTDGAQIVVLSLELECRCAPDHAQSLQLGEREVISSVMPSEKNS